MSEVFIGLNLIFKYYPVVESWDALVGLVFVASSFPLCVVFGEEFSFFCFLFFFTSFVCMKMGICRSITHQHHKYITQRYPVNGNIYVAV